MSVRFDPMTNVVELAGERLADAGAVVAVPGSTHAFSDHGGAQQSLGIDRRLVGSRPDGVAETKDLTPCSGCEWAPTPAPRSDRNNVIAPRMQAGNSPTDLLT